MKSRTRATKSRYETGVTPAIFRNVQCEIPKRCCALYTETQTRTRKDKFTLKIAAERRRELQQQGGECCEGQPGQQLGPPARVSTDRRPTPSRGPELVRDEGSRRGSHERRTRRLTNTRTPVISVAC